MSSGQMSSGQQQVFPSAPMAYSDEDKIADEWFHTEEVVELEEGPPEVPMKSTKPLEPDTNAEFLKKIGEDVEKKEEKKLQKKFKRAAWLLTLFFGKEIANESLKRLLVREATKSSEFNNNKKLQSTGEGEVQKKENYYKWRDFDGNEKSRPFRRMCAERLDGTQREIVKTNNKLDDSQTQIDELKKEVAFLFSQTRNQSPT